MKQWKRLWVLCIVLILLMTGCSTKSDTKEVEIDKNQLKNVNESGMPIVKEPITLNIFAGRTPQSAKDWNDVMIWNEYEDLTNIDVKWEMVADSGLEEKRNLALASGNIPDAFHTASMPSLDIQKYGKQGVFISLNDLIDDYAPNLKKIFEEHPEVKSAVTFPDGNIYSFPTIVDDDFFSMKLGPRPWINQEWLDELDIDMPETLEEYHDFLKAVKDKQPGDGGDIPFGSYSIDMLIRWLNGSFGLVNRGYNHPYVDMDPNKEELRFIPIAEEYKEMLQYVHKLYEEELIEQNIFSIESGQFLANASEGKYGSTVSHSPEDLFSKETGRAFSPAPALEGPHGDKLMTGITPMVTDIGGFVITNVNEHPVATVKWMDYFYSDEGAKLFLMGKEGETYKENEDGDYEYLDKITDSADGLSFEQELAKYLTWPGGGYPGMVKEELFKGLENSPQSREAAKKLEQYAIDEVWPSFNYTEEESKTLSSTGSDIEKYVKEMRDKFITGDVSFDEWDKYVKTVEDMNLDKYMEIERDALERYQSQK
jgi:putative aldouronate transport system substrate-binding protein